MFGVIKINYQVTYIPLPLLYGYIVLIRCSLSCGDSVMILLNVKFYNCFGLHFKRNFFTNLSVVAAIRKGLQYIIDKFIMPHYHSKS